MPPIQTVYSENIDAARAGQVADMGAAVMLSRVAEEVIGFGLPVVEGTADNQALLSDTGDTVILGISVRERSTINDNFAINDNMRVLKSGSIWVTVVATVAPGDPVHVIVAAQTFTNTGGVAIANAVYETSATSGNLARVRIS